MNVSIEEQLKKLQEERANLISEVTVKNSRIKELDKTIKDTEKHLLRAKNALNVSKPE